MGVFGEQTTVGLPERKRGYENEIGCPNSGLCGDVWVCLVLVVCFRVYIPTKHGGIGSFFGFFFEPEKWGGKQAEIHTNVSSPFLEGYF